MSLFKKIFRSLGTAVAYTLGGFLAVVLILVGLVFIFPPHTTPQDVAVVAVAGTLRNDPDIQNYKRSRYVHLSLVEYPRRTFTIENTAFDAAYRGTISEHVASGDSAYLQVATADYQASIAGPHDTTREQLVSVYAFRTQRYVLLTLDGYCRQSSTPNYAAGAIVLLMGLAMLYAIYNNNRRQKRKARSATS